MRNLTHRGKGWSGRDNHSDDKRGQKRSSYTPEKVKRVKEPFPVCPICGKTIQQIAESLHSKAGDGYVHYDCAVREIIKENDIKAPQRVVYAGSGSFAVVEKAANSFRVIKKVAWETSDSFKLMQSEVEGLKE